MQSPGNFYVKYIFPLVVGITFLLVEEGDSYCRRASRSVSFTVQCNIALHFFSAAPVLNFSFF